MHKSDLLTSRTLPRVPGSSQTGLDLLRQFSAAQAATSAPAEASPDRGRGRHRWAGIPPAPTDNEKYGYLPRHVGFIAVVVLMGALSITASQLAFEINDPIAWPFFAFTGLFIVYQLVSWPVNYACRGRFCLRDHLELVASWRPRTYPAVDIYLPICGEPIAVLRNTWDGVTGLVDAYPRARPYVLDDGASDEARALAVEYGFTYIRRDRPGEHKKAGNLRHAFQVTSGEHIVVFDADFRPRADFLFETLPYMDDPTVGIVQTPQYFRVDARQTWIERGAGAVLEVFYRSVQVSRDRLGSALCVGSNAVYRREAIAPFGGFTLIPYAEDSHTGLDARRAGYDLRYLPLCLAAGLCPNTTDSFVRQQYRWATGALSLTFAAYMWRCPMLFRSRLPYLSGILWTVYTAARTLVTPLLPLSLLIFRPNLVEPANFLLLIPAVITGTVLYPLWHRSSFGLSTWPTALCIGWAQTLAIWDYARGTTMSWQPTRTPGDAIGRFRTGIVCWNGALGLLWVVMSVYETALSRSPRFAVIGGLGLVYLVMVARVIFPGEST